MLARFLCHSANFLLRRLHQDIIAAFVDVGKAIFVDADKRRAAVHGNHAVAVPTT